MLGMLEFLPIDIVNSILLFYTRKNAFNFSVCNNTWMEEYNKSYDVGSKTNSVRDTRLIFEYVRTIWRNRYFYYWTPFFSFFRPFGRMYCIHRYTTIRWDESVQSSHRHLSIQNSFSQIVWAEKWTSPFELWMLNKHTNQK